VSEKRSGPVTSRAAANTTDLLTPTIADWTDFATAHRWVRDVARPRWPHAATNDLVWTFSIVLWARGEVRRG
jgi:hypothetical protein